VSDILVADIGGTTSRFALAGKGERPRDVVVIANDEADSAEDAIASALAKFSARPRRAVLAVAGPVSGDEIALTNRAWRFRLPQLKTRFGLERIDALNDFEAIAWALPALRDEDLFLLGASAPREGVKVVLGPGTGLGVAAVVADGAGQRVVASEGGHVSFGAQMPDEEPVFARLRAATGFLSAEGVLSGSGLPRLHQAVNPDAIRLPPETILTQARAGERDACATVSLFVRLLGRFAGDLALTFKATGGVYLAGGIALALGALLDVKRFRRAFEAHSPHGELLAGVPTALMTCDEPGLIGCAVYAAHHGD
jgi:glucokinase